MQKLLKIAGAIFKTKQNHVKWIWLLERTPSIYLGYELISKISKLKLDGFPLMGRGGVTGILEFKFTDQRAHTLKALTLRGQGRVSTLVGG